MSEVGEREQPRRRAGAPLSGATRQRRLLPAVGSTLVALALAGGAFAGLTTLLDEMNQTERHPIEEHETGYGYTAQLATELLGGGTLVALALGVFANLGRRGAAVRKRNEQLIQEQSARLEALATRLRDCEAELARELEVQRALAERLRAANEERDEHVRRLASATAEAQKALAERGHVGQALEKSNRDLEQFTYVAAHDLRAPLRGITTLSEWLEEDLAAAMTDESREHLRLLRGRVSRMDALIEGILAYSRASRARCEPQRVEVASMLRDVLALLVPPAAAVQVHTPEPAPTILVEKAPLEQVWKNLISNALKHGAQEGAEIWLGVKDTGDAWECSVRDNGPGVAPEYHERIFRIFHTLASRDEVEGAGIGLAIVKKLVEDRGGHVWIESARGKGATLYFTWPKS